MIGQVPTTSEIEIEMDTVDPPPEARGLAFFAVDHTNTIGLSLDEIEALRPPVIIDGFLRHGEVMLLGAESKSRKSWLAQDAGFAVAAGQPWLTDPDGCGGFTTVKGRVHVIDLELDRSEIRFRFAKARGNRLPGDVEAQHEVTEAFRSYCFEGLNAAHILPKLEEMKGTVQPGDLVVIDCFYRLVADGNETNEVAKMLETIKRFASETRTGVIVVDHFRKAGDERARNRFAGSFVKQASANTLVAIEVAKDGSLALNIDARTFHGCPVVHARFSLETYSFEAIPDAEIAASRTDRKKAEQTHQIVAAWQGIGAAGTTTASDAKVRWGITRQAATSRMNAFLTAGFVEKVETPGNKADQWKLTLAGRVLYAEAAQLAT
ncbi:helicase RepA family protein [Luteolibacter flavescens]|uniref:Helicase RepA family protein n=1 Tax=Luteolibacter flavescens TaxID=1859460 RepID=A0ABT3FJS1_9BACT|nr:helicase RepA family protein [Luteolibacter flavescens]MCW1883818.1 helicase RepA family protein [Luteolibacter flavescens]